MIVTELGEEPTPPNLAPLEVAVHPEYVVGFPVHVAVLLRADQDGAVPVDRSGNRERVPKHRREAAPQLTGRGIAVRSSSPFPYA